MNIIERAADLLRSKGQEDVWQPDAAGTAAEARPAAVPSNETILPMEGLAPGQAAVSAAAAPAAPAVTPEPVLQPAAPEPATPEPAKRAPKASNVVSIDFAHLRSKGIIVPNAPRGHQVEEFRHVKQRILTQRIDKNIQYPNTIMVTSSVPGEGKTHVAANLAISIALEHDMTVLLVDADFKRPGVPGRFGFKAKKGLIDVLQDPSIDLSEVLLKTDIESLSIIPAGQVHALSAELLASSRMDAVIEELAKRYDDRVIIFDAPPLLATTEPSILAAYVAQVVFVVEAETTRHSSIQAALEVLNTPAHIGFVLNKVRHQFGNADFGQYSYYYNYKPAEGEAATE